MITVSRLLKSCATPAGQNAEGFHLLRLAELLLADPERFLGILERQLGLPPLRHVRRDADHALDLPASVLERRVADVEVDPRHRHARLDLLPRDRAPHVVEDVRVVLVEHVHRFPHHLTRLQPERLETVPFGDGEDPLAVDGEEDDRRGCDHGPQALLHPLEGALGAAHLGDVAEAHEEDVLFLVAEAVGRDLRRALFSKARLERALERDGRSAGKTRVVRGAQTVPFLRRVEIREHPLLDLGGREAEDRARRRIGERDAERAGTHHQDSVHVPLVEEPVAHLGTAKALESGQVLDHDHDLVWGSVRPADRKRR
jgi:hypothetical protein